jgi:hypothetical protein
MAVTKCVQTSRLQAENLEDQLQLAPTLCLECGFPLAV